MNNKNAIKDFFHDIYQLCLVGFFIALLLSPILITLYVLFNLVTSVIIFVTFYIYIKLYTIYNTYNPFKMWLQIRKINPINLNENYFYKNEEDIIKWLDTEVNSSYYKISPQTNNVIEIVGNEIVYKTVKVIYFYRTTDAVQFKMMFDNV